MVIIVSGVAGAGKTTVGQLLARELGWKFYEGDDFHPAANIDKMRRGVALTDVDRQPWLTILRSLIEQCLTSREHAVLACSALKRSYRDYLRVNDDVKLVFLRGDFSRVAEQLRQRRGHFFDPTLRESQFADLEEPPPAEHALVIELVHSQRELVDEIKALLQLQSAGFGSREDQ